MGSLIKVYDTDLTEYEQLLLFREQLYKESLQYEQEYIRKFGTLTLNLFKKKMECIRLKKSIEYCQRFLNRGAPVDQKKLQEYLEKEISLFKSQLNEIKLNNELAKKGKSISQMDLLQIKHIYQKLVKRLHPDINPAFVKSKNLKELWHRICFAYRCNDLAQLIELEVLVNKALTELGKGINDFEIPDLKEKIVELKNEIDSIQNTDPYLYKFLLENKKAVREKTQQLKTDIKNYEMYFKELQEMEKSLGVKNTFKSRLQWVVN